MNGTTAAIRVHSSDDMADVGELADVTDPVAVVLRADGSVDVYGQVAVVDQRTEPQLASSAAADYATYAAARMNAAGGMEDAEAKADGSALIIEVHQVPVYRAEFVCTAPKCAEHGNHVYGKYTEAQLKAAFALVPKDPENWKMPVRGFVPEGSDTEAMGAAIAFYCGSPSEFTPQPDGRFAVDAPGYYMCVGA
jgi:hypothetical protein